jgi:hypothetical protein
VYIASSFSEGAPAGAADQSAMAWALFALNSLVFFGAMAASYFAHDPDESLDHFHKALKTLDRKRNALREKAFRLSNGINGEIQAAKSQIDQVRQLTSQRVALYRQTNIRFRRLLPPYSFRKNPDFPALKLWPEVSVNGENGPPDER